MAACAHSLACLRRIEALMDRNNDSGLSAMSLPCPISVIFPRKRSPTFTAAKTADESARLCNPNAIAREILVRVEGLQFNRCSAV